MRGEAQTVDKLSKPTSFLIGHILQGQFCPRVFETGTWTDPGRCKSSFSEFPKIPSVSVVSQFPVNLSSHQVPQSVIEDAAQLVKANSIQGNKMNDVDVVGRSFAETIIQLKMFPHVYTHNARICKYTTYVLLFVQNYAPQICLL